MRSEKHLLGKVVVSLTLGTIALAVVAKSHSDVIAGMQIFAGKVNVWLFSAAIQAEGGAWESPALMNLALVFIAFGFAAYLITTILINLARPAFFFPRFSPTSDPWNPGGSAGPERAVPGPGLLGPAMAGGVIVFLFFCAFVGWAAMAPLSSAAIAPGKVTVESERKTIQHLEGGIVSRIRVRDGEQVKAGQILIELDETKPRALLARSHSELAAKDQRIALLRQEIAVVGELLSKGLTSRPRLLALQRREADVIGQRGGLRAEIEDAKYILKRSQIRATIDGTIVALKVHSIGGVIKSGEPLMDIVPKRERLVIQAIVNPIDIDVVHAGLEAMVYLTPYNRRSLKPIRARVTVVSADLMTDNRSDKSYYLAEIEPTEDPGKAIAGAVLYPGMPVEVMILTGKRTLLQSLVQPIFQSLNRAFRED